MSERIDQRECPRRSWPVGGGFTPHDTREFPLSTQRNRRRFIPASTIEALPTRVMPVAYGGSYAATVGYEPAAIIGVVNPPLPIDDSDRPSSGDADERIDAEATEVWA